MFKNLILVLIFLVAAIYFMISHQLQQQGNFQIGTAKLSVEIAADFVKQYQGLSGRETLCQNCGMLFVFEKPKIQNFVMRGMKFPLDFVFISHGRIVELSESVPPPRGGETPLQIISTVPADMVLEINAGFISKHQIKIGNSATLKQK